MSPRFMAVVGAVLIVVAVPSRVLAHPLVDQAREQLGEALFVDALDTLARAEAGDDLSVEDLAELLAVRALTHRALGNDGAMEADLARLAVVAPDYAFDRRAVPEVRRAFAEARAGAPGAVRVVATPSLEAGGVTVSAETDNDVERLVRTVRISGREVGEDAWEHAEGAPLFIAGEEVEYYAEAVGPGGAVIASSGSASDPHRFGGGESDEGDEVLTGGAVEDGDDDGGGGAGLWIGLGVGLAVVAAVGITLAIVLGGGGGESSQLEPFMVRF